MIEEKTERELAVRMTAWYHEHGRDLPWRRTKDPYCIWISEIMLQQTQVETVKPYYERFIRTLPTVTALADADQAVVYKLWEGLGYYRRASHLQEAAQTIVTVYGGVFPDTYEVLIGLKGIGMYTASAIASIAYGLPRGVVDGNTLRIIARVFNREDNIALQKTRQAFGQVMDRLIAWTDPSDFNQGMMDLGAMICTPAKPRCGQCPIADLCEGRRMETAKRLPVNVKKVHKAVVEYMTAVIRDGDSYFMIQNKGGMLEHLYGFVQYACDAPSEFERLFYEQYGLKLRLQAYIRDVKHVFTHREWRMHVYSAQLERESSPPESGAAGEALACRGTADEPTGESSPPESGAAGEALACRGMADEPTGESSPPESGAAGETLACRETAGTARCYTPHELEQLPVSTAHMKVLKAYLKYMEN